MAIALTALTPQSMPPNVPISKRVILINMGATIIARVVNIGVLIWVIQHLMNRLSPDQYQLIPLIGSLTIILPIFTAALTSGLARFTTEAYAQNDNRRVTEITSTMFVITTGAAVIMAVLVGVLAWHVGDILAIPEQYLAEAQWMVLLMLGTLVLQLPVAPLNVGLYVRQRFVLQSAISTLAMLFRAGLLLGLIIGVSAQPLWFAVAAAGETLVRTLCSLYFSLRLLPALRVQWSAVNWAIARPITAFGTWATIGRIAQTVRDAADPIILNQLSTSVQVNTLHAGSIIERQLRAMLVMLLGTIEPALTALHATKQDKRLQRAFVRGTRINLWLGMFFALPILIFHKEIMQLWLGQRFDLYSESTTVLLLLTAMYPLYLACNVLPRIASARGLIGQITRRTIFVEFGNLGLTFIFVGGLRMGAVGAATATFCSAVMRFWLYAPLIEPLTGANLRQFWKMAIVPGLFPACCAFVAGVLMRVLIEPVGAFVLVQCIVGVCLIYLLLLFMILDQADRADLQRLTAHIRSASRTS